MKTFEDPLGWSDTPDLDFCLWGYKVISKVIFFVLSIDCYREHIHLFGKYSMGAG